MAGTTRRVGDADAPNKLIVVEPADDPPGVRARNRGSGNDFLDRQAFVAACAFTFLLTDGASPLDGGVTSEDAKRILVAGA